MRWCSTRWKIIIYSPHIYRGIYRRVSSTYYEAHPFARGNEHTSGLWITTPTIPTITQKHIDNVKRWMKLIKRLIHYHLHTLTPPILLSNLFVFWCYYRTLKLKFYIYIYQFSCCANFYRKGLYCHTLCIFVWTIPNIATTWIKKKFWFLMNCRGGP